MSLSQWADAAVTAIINYSDAWPLVGSDWQSWGMLFFVDPYLSRLDPPNPYDFSDWQLWGERLSDAMSQASGSPGSVKKLVTQITVTASPFTWTNSTGRAAVLTVTVNGATISALTINGAAITTPLEAPPFNQFLVQPGNTAVITYSVSTPLLQYV